MLSKSRLLFSPPHLLGQTCLHVPSRPGSLGASQKAKRFFCETCYFYCVNRFLLEEACCAGVVAHFLPRICYLAMLFFDVLPSALDVKSLLLLLLLHLRLLSVFASV